MHVPNDTEEARYAIALSLVRSLTVRTLDPLLQQLGDSQALFHEARQSPSLFSPLPEALCDQLRAPGLLDEAARIQEQCLREGISFHPFYASSYPHELLSLSQPPTLIYTRGEPFPRERRLSIVGTRQLTSYGERLISELITALSHLTEVPVIISGLAYGADITAHRAALEAGLPTTAVLAHGLDRIRPAAHRAEAEAMLQQGGWVSEYPPGREPWRRAFVFRNRLIAALSPACIVIEAGSRSGTLSTAHYAREAGRRVYAYPGRLSDPMSAGCLQLIARGMAQLCTSPDLILEDLGWASRMREKKHSGVTPPKGITPPISAPTHDPNDPLQQLLYERGALPVDELASALSQSVEDVSERLFLLELEGRIEATAGSCYQLVR